MAIEITRTAEDKIWINGKIVVRDMNNHWVAQSELMPMEESKLREDLNENGLIHE